MRPAALLARSGRSVLGLLGASRRAAPVRLASTPADDQPVSPRAVFAPRRGVFDESLIDLEGSEARSQQRAAQEEHEKGASPSAPAADAGASFEEAAAAEGMSPEEAAAAKRRYDGSEAVDAELWRNTARKRDRDGALAASFLPEDAAEAMYLLRCLNSDVSRVLDSARGNAAAAAMRFQFWHDLVSRAAAGRGHPHPMAVPLSVVMARFNLTERYLHRLIDARAQDAAMRVGDSGTDATGGSYRPQTLEDLEEYADATEGSLALLALETLGVRGNAAAEAAAGYVSRSAVLANTVRGMRLHASMGQLYLPTEVTDAHDLSPAALLRVFRLVARERDVQSNAKRLGATERGGAPAHGNRTVGANDDAVKQHERVVACAYDVAVAAHDNLQAAEALAGQVPKEAAAALLTAVPTRAWLKHFEAIGFDPCSPDMAPRNQLAVMARLYWHWARGTY